MRREALAVQRRFVVAIAMVFAVATCSGGNTGAAGQRSTPAVASVLEDVQGMPDAPVDTTLEPVSIGSPPAGAKQALSLCVQPDEMSKVSGMAELPADDVHRFMLTNGREPELQTRTPVWAIQFKGTITRRTGDLIDPLCVVIDGISSMFVPYGRVGETTSPVDGFVEPSAALPSLAP